VNGRVPTEDVEGLVEAVNAKGLKIGGAWINVSQFNPVELPQTGAHVRLKVDSRGYIKELATMTSERIPTVLSPKDDRITRLAVLKAAAEFVGLWGQSREEVKSDHVLVLADKWLKWVEQE
jgi:hypothetical protein